MADYATITKIVLNNDSKFDIASELTVQLGRKFEDPGDDFYGLSTIVPGETKVGGATVQAVAVSKNNKSALILVNDNIYTLTFNHNPFTVAENKIFTDTLWSGADAVKKRASKDEVQGDRDYAVKGLPYVKMEDVQSFYSRADAGVRKFLMETVGDESDSLDESEGRRAFPKGIDEEWMYNRFVQTSSFLGEVFAFPDEITREVLLSSFLTRGGSCLLSGIPGSGKTVLAELGCILLFNGYGFSSHAYRQPIRDLATGRIKPFIYRDINHRGDDKSSSNILTVPPTKDQLDAPGREWVLVPNIETTDKTEVVVTDKDPKKFVRANKTKLNKADVEALDTGKIKIGRNTGPTKTQVYSRARTGDRLSDWNEERFDEHLLNRDFGMLRADYYSRSLLKREGVKNPSGNVDSLYVSDILYDMARYPDTHERVKWVDEVADEKRFMKHESELNDLKIKRRSMTNDADIHKADERIDEIEAMMSNIHKKRDLPRDEWATVYGQGRKGKMSDNELEKINHDYTFNLYENLYELVNRVDNNFIYNARNENDILNEMLFDMGIVTCSENKTPEDILYSMDISLVEDRDSIGRPVQQYVFKPTPLDFVTKPGKFINEFTRADKDFQDQLLSLLDRGIVEYRGERFKSPEFTMFCDNNPHKLLTAKIDWALWDRIDVEIYLKGASLGTKDMVLSRKFGRNDVLMGKTGMKSNMQKELLTRVRFAVNALNDYRNSQLFRDQGLIHKEQNQPQGIIPMRVRDIRRIWDYVDNVSIPRDVLRYVFLLTTTMNQAWYLRKMTVNDGNLDLEIPGTEVVGKDYHPYGDPGNLQSRDTMMDFSMLSFATDFIKLSGVISNIGMDKAKEQFPLGITRPVGIRFVESLLKYAKALAWLRRGHTQVSIKEVDDLFPLVGSHRLNIMPFGEEHEAGIDETMKGLFPNIQDYLRNGILKSYWFDRKDQYIQYYADLESVIDAGFLDVDSCAPSELDSRAGGLCKIRGNYSHSSLQSQEKTDVMILDIQNGVEFAKRNSPDYKRHYARRLSQIMNISGKNYYEDFISASEKYIKTNDNNVKKIPMLLFKNDSNELIGRLSDMKKIFEPDHHTQTLTDMSIVSRIVIGILDGFTDYVDPASLQKLTKARSDFEELIYIYKSIIKVQNAEDVNVHMDSISKILKKSSAELGKMSRDDILKSMNGMLDRANISATGIKLKPYTFKTTDSKGKSIELKKQGKFSIVYKPGDAEQHITLTAKSFNDHLLWEYVRFSESLDLKEPVEDTDMIV